MAVAFAKPFTRLAHRQLVAHQRLLGGDARFDPVALAPRHPQQSGAAADGPIGNQAIGGQCGQPVGGTFFGRGLGGGVDQPVVGAIGR